MESVLVVPKHFSPEHGPTSGPAAVMGGCIAVNEKLGRMSLGLGEEKRDICIHDTFLHIQI